MKRGTNESNYTWQNLNHLDPQKLDTNWAGSIRRSSWEDYQNFVEKFLDWVGEGGKKVLRGV